MRRASIGSDCENEGFGRKLEKRAGLRIPSKEEGGGGENRGLRDVAGTYLDPFWPLVAPTSVKFPFITSDSVNSNGYTQVKESGPVPRNVRPLPIDYVLQSAS